MGSDSAPLVSPNKGGKTRMGVLLRQSLGEKSQNRHGELDDLKARYQTLCQRLKTVQKALKDRHAALLSTAQARVSLAAALSSMSKETPLEATVGAPEEEGGKSDAYAALMMNSLDRKTRKRADDFHSFAIDYAQNWEKTVTTRVNADMKQTEALRRDADHYKTKVESLQANISKLQAANKPVPDSTAEKFSRNEKKLQEANSAYSSAAQDLYLLMDEVVDRSWRDLHPLLLKILEWDVDVCQEERDTLCGSFERMQSDLMILKKKQSIAPRLQDMVDGTPEMLCTRTDGVPSLNLSTSASSGANSFDDGDAPEKQERNGFTRQNSGGYDSDSN